MPEPERSDEYGRSEPIHDDGILVKDHLERDVKTVCAYCGQPFEEGEVVIECEIHGRTWRFCSEDHYRDFLDALDFQDEDLDAYEPGTVHVGDDDE